jgi:hypothetical protein
MKGVVFMQVMNKRFKIMVVMAIRKTWSEIIPTESQVRLPDPKIMTCRTRTEEEKNDLNAHCSLSDI